LESSRNLVTKVFAYNTSCYYYLMSVLCVKINYDDDYEFWTTLRCWADNQANSVIHPSWVDKRVIINLFTRITEVEIFNNGRLGLHAAVWLHMSKSVSEGLGRCGLG